MANPNPSIRSSVDGKRLRRIKGARNAHKVMLAQGRSLMAEARAAALELRHEKRQAKELLARAGNRWSANVDGV